MVSTQEESSMDYVTKEASTTRNGEEIGLTIQETTPTIPKDSKNEPISKALLLLQKNQQ